MGKVKIKLVSGSEMEKSVLTAFKAESNTVVVLDNESTGSMGLPIILVCKLIDNKLIKIIDQNEWQKTKDYLKQIIAGGSIDYITVNNDLLADDVFYTQLTLPIASYDAIKNNYVPADAGMPIVEPAAPVVESVSSVNQPVMPVVEPTNMVNDPVIPTVGSEVNVIPTIPEITPIIPETPVDNEPVINSFEPVTEIPVQEPVMEPSGPVIPEVTPIVESVPEVTVEPVLPEIPVVEPVISETQIPTEEVPAMDSSVQTNEIEVDNNQVNLTQKNYDEIKESFMKSCENMFDALVLKFENKE